MKLRFCETQTFYQAFLNQAKWFFRIGIAAGKLQAEKLGIEDGSRH